MSLKKSANNERSLTIMPRPSLVCTLAFAMIALAHSPSWGQKTTPAPCIKTDGCYLDIDRLWKNESLAYAQLMERNNLHYIRYTIEMAVLLGSGTAWYWIDRERQVADWDFPSVSDRLTFKAWRFDNNQFGINFLGHPINGVGFHTLARSNNFSMLGAVGAGFATSMVWEFALEFREKISINDVLVTTGAGVSIGEFLHWLGRYVNSAPGGGRTGHKIAAWMFGVQQALHNRIDREKPPPDGQPTDSLGFSPHIWHRFQLSSGYSLATNASNDNPTDKNVGGYRLDLKGKLAAIPGYLRPGRFHRWFSDGNVTELSIAATVGEGDGMDISSETILFGVHHQHIPAPSMSIGEAVTLGAAIGYQYRDETFGQFRDRLGILHFPGPAIDLHLVGSSWHLRVASRLHADFAGVNAPLFRQWREANPDTRTKEIVQREGYYYGLGLSTRLNAELTFPWVELGGSVFHGRYRSKQGLDKDQEELTTDIKLSDTVLDLEAWLRIAPMDSRYFVGFHTIRRKRTMRLESFRGEQSLRLYIFQAGLRL